MHTIQGFKHSVPPSGRFMQKAKILFLLLIEVSTLINRKSKEDLSDLMSLFHAIMAVLDSDLCSLTLFKLSPFILNNTGLNLQCLRNKFTNELIESEGKMPEPPETTCIPDKTRETMFLSESMELEIPYQQLLNNPNLDFRDMAAIGVRIRKKNMYEIRPIFSGKLGENHISQFLLFLLGLNEMKNRFSKLMFNHCEL